MRQRTVAYGVIAAAVLMGGIVWGQGTPPARGPARGAATVPATKPAMELIIPTRGGSGVPANNDYNNPESDFSFKHSKQTEHFVLFWHKEYGDDPASNTGNRHFAPDEIMKEVERFYDYYVNDLKWVDKEKSLAVKNKFLIYIISNSSGGTAFGGSIENRIGAFWSPASRVARGPYGVVAHELGHSFQALGRADGAASFSGPNVGEMTSQYMLWQVYPEWTTFENYHLVAYMKDTHLAFLHPSNQYHSCFPFEYWSNKHGVELMGRLWREVQRPEDIVMTYKRITKVDQKAFNDEMFDACRRFVTWDMPRIEKTSAQYADQHTTVINKAAAPAAAGWYQIDNSKVPQNYGYNAIKLKVPAAGTKVTIDFKGIAGAPGFSAMQVDKAGWRYGFLAHKEDGTRVYSEVFSKSEGTGEFTVPAASKFLWLVVMGAPTEHFTFSQGGRGGGGRGGRGATTGPATGPATVPATRGAAGEPEPSPEVGGAAAGAGGGAGAATRGAGAGAGAGAAGGRGARGGAGGGGGRAGGAAGGGAPAPVTNEQWPYQFKLTGTSPDDSVIR